MVRQLEGLTQTGPGWENRLLHAIARLEIVRIAYTRRAVLPKPLADEAATAVGRTRTQEELAGEPAVADCWRVLGMAQENEDRLSVRRTWLLGRQTRRPALLLDFAAGSQAMDVGLPLGCEFDGELAFYPGSAQLRAAIRSRSGTPRTSGEPLTGSASISDALSEYADALGQTPWLERMPMRLTSVRPALRVLEDGYTAATLIDDAGHAIPLSRRFAQAWHLLAVSGGAVIDVFGEWDGETLMPLTVGCGSAIYAVGSGLQALRALETT
jgi:hypothetical protein